MNAGVLLRPLHFELARHRPLAPPCGRLWPSCVLAALPSVFAALDFGILRRSRPLSALTAVCSVLHLFRFTVAGPTPQKDQRLAFCIRPFRVVLTSVRTFSQRFKEKTPVRVPCLHELPKTH